MKKKYGPLRVTLTVVVFILLLVLAAALVLIGPAELFGLGDSGAPLQLRFANDYLCEDVREIRGSFNRYDVELLLSEDGDSLRVEQHCSAQVDPAYLFTVSQEEGVITITLPEDNSVRGLFRSLVGTPSLVRIWIPRKYAGSLNLGVTSGAITCRADFALQNLTLSSTDGAITMTGKLNCNGTYITSSSGKIELALVSGLNLQIKTSSGAIVADSLEASASLDLTCISGSVAIRSINSGSQSVITDSGTVEIVSISGAGRFKTGPGSIKARFDAVNGDIVLEAGPGNILCAMPRNANVYTQTKVTSSGVIYDDFANLTGMYFVSATVTSGRIDIIQG